MPVQLQYKIALNLIPHIGPLLARRLVAYTGSAEAVFTEKKSVLQKIPGIGPQILADLHTSEILSEAGKEMEYIQKHGIQTYFYLDANYPKRLAECEDAPVILYARGDTDYNTDRVLSVVGTRSATEYGKAITEEIIAGLARSFPKTLIISGLAYGIDICAHRTALKNKLQTVAVLGHGLEFLYPSAHAQIAREIREQGALLTEFRGKRKPDPGNFISRNRIIAGLADATLVVESAPQGGALLTADMANSYNRDVLAVPGRATDLHSKGCNDLIKRNKAALVECSADVEAALGWMAQAAAVQKQIVFDLTDAENRILNYLMEQGDSPLDLISRFLDLPVATLSAQLLQLEFKGLVKSLPGKVYRKI